MFCQVFTPAEDEHPAAGWETVTIAVPFTDALCAVIVKGPPAELDAVNRPFNEMLPPPLSDQENVG
jgi:hypothetical protein